MRNSRSSWTKTEDHTLFEMLKNKSEPIDWEETAEQMQRAGYKRTYKQIKSRWNNHLDPVLTKEKWSKEDILKLFNNFDVHGNRWQLIAADFVGRTDNSIKNQLFSSIRKSLRLVVKKLGLETAYSYTVVINQIRPKILADFLAQKISIKLSDDDDRVCELNASDFIKSFVFKSNSLYSADQVYHTNDVMHAFLELLVNMNEEYIAKKQLSKIQSKRNPPTNATHNQNSSDMEESRLSRHVDQAPVSQHIAHREAFVPVGSNNTDNTDINRILNNIKQAFLDGKLKSSADLAYNDKMKNQYTEIFEKFEHLSSLLVIRLCEQNVVGLDDLKRIAKFLNSIEFMGDRTNERDETLPQPGSPIFTSKSEDVAIGSSIIDRISDSQKQSERRLTQGDSFSLIRKHELPKPLKRSKN